MAHPGDKGKLEKDLAAMAGARSVVIWSSAIGVRALVEGIPVQHFAPHWICETWAKDREAACSAWRTHSGISTRSRPASRSHA